MNKMGFILLGACCVGLLGCEDAPRASTPATPSGPYWVTCQGTIWDVERTKDGEERQSQVVIAGDDGTLFTVNLTDKVPAATVGLRGIFTYESANRERGLWKNFMVKRRFLANPANTSEVNR